MADTTTTTTDKPPATDPWTERLLGDLGVGIDGKTGEVVQAESPSLKTQPTNDFVTLGEIARANAEKKAAEKKEETPPAEGDKKSEPKKEETPPAAAEGTPPAKKEDEPPKPKIEVETEPPLKDLVEGLVRKVASELKPAPEPAAAPKKEEPAKTATEATTDPDAQFIRTLTDEQKEDLELSEWAAQQDPKKYGSLRKELLEYYHKLDEFVTEKLKEDEEWEAEKDPEFNELVSTERPLSRRERRELEKNKLLTEVKAEVKAEYQPKFDQAEQEKRASNLEPEILKVTESYDQFVIETMTTNDKSPLAPIAAGLKAKNYSEEAWSEAKSTDKLGANIVKKYTDEAVKLGREYMRVTLGAKKLDTGNPVHKTVFGWVAHQEEAFKQNGGELRVRDGKQFVTHKEWDKMSEQERAKHWTSSELDVLTLLGVLARNMATDEYNAEIQRRTDEGYVRSNGTPKKEEPKKEEPKPTKKESPKATLSSSPGAGSPGQTPEQPTVMSMEELKRSWSNGSAMLH